MIKSILYFIAELFFDDKEEYKFNSAKFNARKTIAALIMVMSILTNLFMINRLYHIALRNVTLRTDLAVAKQELEALKDLNKTGAYLVIPDNVWDLYTSDSFATPESSTRRNFANRTGPTPSPPRDFSPAKNLWGVPSDDGKRSGTP